MRSTCGPDIQRWVRFEYIFYRSDIKSHFRGWPMDFSARSNDVHIFHSCFTTVKTFCTLNEFVDFSQCYTQATWWCLRYREIFSIPDDNHLYSGVATRSAKGPAHVGKYYRANDRPKLAMLAIDWLVILVPKSLPIIGRELLPELPKTFQIYNHINNDNEISNLAYY